MSIPLEFFHNRGEYVVAEVTAGEPPAIPNVGDYAQVPALGEHGKFPIAIITSRQFIYDSNGVLVKVQLCCTIQGE